MDGVIVVGVGGGGEDRARSDRRAIDRGVVVLLDGIVRVLIRVVLHLIVCLDNFVLHDGGLFAAAPRRRLRRDALRLIAEVGEAQDLASLLSGSGRCGCRLGGRRRRRERRDRGNRRGRHRGDRHRGHYHGLRHVYRLRGRDRGNHHGGWRGDGVPGRRAGLGDRDGRRLLDRIVVILIVLELREHGRPPRAAVRDRLCGWGGGAVIPAGPAMP